VSDLDIDPERPAAPPKDAATVLVLRPADEGFVVFMVRRHQKSGFMGGAYVFPGGKLDDADVALPAQPSTLDAAGAARALGEAEHPERALGLFVAAVRETFEEAGVLLADVEDASAIPGARARLLAGEPFAALIRELDARLRLDRLVPWTRWVTPAVEPRRYDTRFFLAVAPAGQDAAHDAHETTEAAWLRPEEALEHADRGEIALPPPTMRSLEMLAPFSSIDAVLEDARSRTPPLVEPVFVDDAGTWTLLLPGDPDHPVRERRIPGPTRFVLADGRWWSR
jgi:8-oxo-dGTP pyrophosphatase MutT (NUDIX family)